MIVMTKIIITIVMRIILVIILMITMMMIRLWLDYHYFESNLKLTLLIKVFLTKQHVVLFCSILNMTKYFPSWVYVCEYPLFHWGHTFKKMLSKVWSSQKDKKRVRVQIPYRRWVQTNLQTDNLLMFDAEMGKPKYFRNLHQWYLINFDLQILWILILLNFLVLALGMR